MARRPARPFARRALAAVAVGAACLGLHAPAQAQRTETHVCAKPQEQRRVEIVYRGAESVPCDLWYTTGGARQRLAWAMGTAGYCERKRQDLLDNLARAGFRCARQDQAQAAPPPAPSPPTRAAPPAPAAPAAITGLRQCLDRLQSAGSTCQAERHEYEVVARARTNLAPDEGDVEVDLVNILRDSGRAEVETGAVFLVSREAEPRGLPLKGVLTRFQWSRSVDLNGDGRHELLVASTGPSERSADSLAVHVFGGGATLGEIVAPRASLDAAAVYVLASRKEGYADLLAIAGDVVSICTFTGRYACTPIQRLDSVSGAARP
jgi:hypothetical protein